jgi:ABC-2 type transport system permease protein
MRAFRQLFLANLREFMRDRMALFWTIAFPVLFIVIFGTIFGQDSNFSADVGLVVEDQGPAAERQVATLREVEPLKLSEGGREERLAVLRAGDLDAVIVIPAGTSAAFEAGKTAPVQVHLDPSRSNSTTILPMIERVVQGVGQQLKPTPAVFAVEPVQVQSVRLSVLDFLLPGILAMSIMQLGLFATALPLISLRQQGILRRLGATPLPRGTLLAAYIAMRLIMAFIQAGIIILVGVFGFGATMAGSWMTFVVLLMLGALTFISIGFLIAAVARTEEAGNALTSTLQFPMMFLSGIFFPLSIMPDFLKPVINALPLTYLADAMRQEMISSTPYHSMGTNVAVMLAWLAATTMISIRFFKWE